jgi:hypothetical protein
MTDPGSLYGPSSAGPNPSGALPQSPAYVPGPVEPKQGNPLGIAALIVGILAVIGSIIPFISFVAWLPALVAIGLGIAAVVLKNRKKVLGAIGLGLGVLALIISIVVSVITVTTLAGAIGEQIESSLAPITEPTIPDFTEGEEGPVTAPGEAVGFGETVDYGDGVSISVSAPQPFTPTEYASGADQPVNVVYSITITNGSSENIDPLPYSQVASGGTEGSQIFDFDNEAGDVTTYPTTTILPGGSVTWLEAWSISDPENVTYQIAPSYDYGDAIFTNAK